MKQSMSSIAYTESFEVKPKFDRHFDSKSYRILLKCTILHGKRLVLLATYVANCAKIFQFFYHSLHVWYHEILTNLIIFRLHLLFIEFKNNSVTYSWSCLVNRMFDIFFPCPDKPHIGANNMNIIFPFILVHYSNHLQFKFILSLKKFLWMK